MCYALPNAPSPCMSAHPFVPFTSLPTLLCRTLGQVTGPESSLIDGDGRGEWEQQRECTYRVQPHQQKDQQHRSVHLNTQRGIA